MQPIEPFEPTGRLVGGPAADLVEMADPDSGYVATALVYHDPWRHHPALSREVPQLRRFLENPMVCGLGELDAVDPRQGAFVYPTGPVWALSEVLDTLRAQGRAGGVRAGLELCYTGALVLQDAFEVAEPYEIDAHGDISPWRLVVQPDGELMVLGYGVPPVAFFAWREGTAEIPDEALRYAPPERLADVREELTADLFSLALVAAELMLGEPLYPGSGDDLLAIAKRGNAKERLFRQRDKLPADVIEVLGEALDFYPDSRHRDGHALLRPLADLLVMPTVLGPTLAALTQELAPRLPKLGGPAAGRVEREAPIPEAPRHAISQRWSRVERERAEAPGAEHALDLRGSRTARHRANGERKGFGRQRRDRNAMFPRNGLRRAERYLVSVDGGRERWAKLDPDQTLAESAARLVDALCETPLSPTGHLQGWYRIWQGDGCWYGDCATDVLDPDEPVELRWIDNELVSVTIDVEGEDVSGTLDMDVGTAVHARFLVSSLQRQLDLDGRRWRLVVDDRPLDPWQVLDDFEPEPGFALRLVRG